MLLLRSYMLLLTFLPPFPCYCSFVHLLDMTIAVLVHVITTIIHVIPQTLLMLLYSCCRLLLLLCICHYYFTAMILDVNTKCFDVIEMLLLW
jgi:hypothetical protein